MKRYIKSSLGDNWVRHDDGAVVSTNTEGYQLLHCDDRSLNADVFHWKVLDTEGNVVLDTGRLGYGYTVSYIFPIDENYRGEIQYGDTIYLKCIVDEYGFSDKDVLNSLSDTGIRERYKAVCGQGYAYKYGYPQYWTDDRVFDALDKAKSSGIINKFKHV